MPNNSIEPVIQKFDLAKVEFDLSMVFRKFSSLRQAIFLDGCGDRQSIPGLNRYSFLAADPIDVIQINDGESFDWSILRDAVKRFPLLKVAGLPPFQGGLGGFLSYEFGQRPESIRPSKISEFDSPQFCFGIYDVVFAIDHSRKLGWLISQGWPESDPVKRKSRANHRIRQFIDLLNDNQLPTANFQIGTGNPQSEMNRVATFEETEIFSDFSKEKFLDTVADAVELIREGDVFQVNLSQRLLSPITKSSPDLYLDMRRVNPAPFSGYFDFGSGQIISASPERLVKIDNDLIETRPIKGTRKRTRYPEVDLNTQLELLSSEKDRAENTMIVDLMRNDLSKVSSADSVVVEKLCGIEEFQNVMHLVSVVQSRLDMRFDCFDAIANLFPGGSITGAPKIRAMEIISELEPTIRGPYCGSLGYISFDGQIDFNILIRTVTAMDGWWQIPVGGGIVSDSKPEFEYEETWTKAVGMLNAIRFSSAVQIPHTVSDSFARMAQ